MHTRSAVSGLTLLFTLVCVLRLAASRADTLYVPSLEFPTIQSAAWSAAPGDTIEIAPGVYNEHVQIDARPLTVRGAGMDVTIVDGFAAFGSWGQSSQPLVTLADLTIGSMLSSVEAYGANLMMSSCRVSAPTPGGLRAVGSTLDIVNCVFDGNHVAGGGGLLSGGAMKLEGCTTHIVGTTISNSSAPGHGGGIYAEGGSLVMENCSVTGNEAAGDGGGICADGCTADIRNCTISGNVAYWHGGGIAIVDGSATLIGNVIESNRAVSLPEHYYHGGGGIALLASWAEILGNTIRNNYADNAAGGILERSSLATIAGNTIIGNQAVPGPGGGAYLEGSDLVENNVIAENDAYTGAAMTIAGFATIVNNTIANNWDFQILEVLPYIANNIVYNTRFLCSDAPLLLNNCFYNAGYTDPSGVNADPMFVDSAHGDYHLRADSPCINAGLTDAVWPDFATDYYGAPRIVGAAVDIGAAEYQGPTAADLRQLLTRITELRLRGEIDNDGIAKSLSAKVRAALSALTGGDTAAERRGLLDLVSECRAQRGKHIATAAAAELINTATGFLQYL